MTDKPVPKCPMGHDMELFQVAGGGWRYGCIQCATSYKAIKRRSYGWLSPIKSTKERAYEAAIRRPLQKPLTCEQGLARLNDGDPVWIEERFGVGGWDFPAGLRFIPLSAEEKKMFSKVWRFWATKPTDEERAAAKWEDEDHAE